MIEFSDVNECASSPCEGGGQCIDSVNSFSCICPDGRIGQFCEIGKNLFVCLVS